MAEPRIALTLADSVSERADRPFNAERPNVVVIVVDDLGFAQLGAFGSDLETPNLDRLAADGVRFTNFHTTGMCSPTRAAMLTGRNHHRVGMGMLPDLPIGFPGYTGEFPEGAGTLPEILRTNGYATAAIGKWHLVPRDQRATGPFNMWPTGLGFERYYGFLNGETNMWTPNLIRDQSHIEPPATPDEGYHLEADLADQAVRWLRDLRLHAPSRPFMLWYATAAPHAPHQAPAEWIDRFAGRFDNGWDDWRERAFAQQQRLGITVAHATMAPCPEWIEPWAEIDPDRRRLYSRMMECFAGFLAYTDHQIGRVLDALEDNGDLDNTVIVFASDNGCSAEGGPNGTWNQLRHYIGDEPDNLDDEFAHFDDLGGFRSSGHYPWGWAFAGNTPFRRWKRYTFEGGVRDPLVIRLPGGAHGGELRHQYCHAVDIMATVLDLVGIEAPATLGGVDQLSLDGTSLQPVIDNASADEVRTEQYFELWGSRAMYANGWKAVTNHVNQLTAHERDHLAGSSDFTDDVWELFDTRTDPTETIDLASTYPDIVADLADRWDRAALANQVLPLDDSRDNRVTHMRLPWYEFQPTYTFRPGDKVHESHGPFMGASFRLAALFSGDGVPDNASGVLCEQGDWIAGWAFYLRNGTATWVCTTSGRERRIDADVPSGTRSLEFTLRPSPADSAAPSGADDPRFTYALAADDVEIGRTTIEEPVPFAWAPDGAFLTVGYGRPFPVTTDYDPPSTAPKAFAGLRFDLGEPGPVNAQVEIARILRHQ